MRAARNGERDDADEHVQRHGHKGRDRHVEHAQQVEAGEKAADHGARDVAAIKEAQPGHPARRGFHPP